MEFGPEVFDHVVCLKSSGFNLLRPCLISSGVNIYNPITKARSIHGLRVITNRHKPTLCHMECTHVVQWHSRKNCCGILASAASSTCLQIGCRPQSLTWYINNIKIILNLQNSVLNNNICRSPVRKTRTNIIAYFCRSTKFQFPKYDTSHTRFRELHRCAVTARDSWFYPNLPVL